MKLSLNTAQLYSPVDLTPNGLDRLIEAIGRQLGAVESVTDWGDKYDRLVVAKVSSVKPHPAADKLSVCLIDDGGASAGVRRRGGLIEVVCGAPNVAKGQLVAYIPPGAIVPAAARDAVPAKLTAKEIRGVTSHGMIASLKELDIGNDHDGILVIEPAMTGKASVRPGMPFKQLYGLDDVIIELENKMFTHRPDCFGILGVARELAGIQGQKFISPDWYLNEPKLASRGDLRFKASVEAAELVPRLMIAGLDQVSVGPSPLWLQSLLIRLGTQPINNVVDITNFVMFLTGQPLHAYDYDKVAALSGGEATIKVRLAGKKEPEFKLLNDQAITPRPGDILITTDKAILGLGGIMGGAETEVDESTKRLLLECGTFDMFSLRRTGMAHGLFTEALTRFTKGQSPLQNDRALSFAIDQLKSYAAARPAGPTLDIKTTSESVKPIKTDLGFINRRLGTDLSTAEAKRLLRAVELQIDGADQLVITPPFWRRDLRIAEDIVEETGRLYGYHQLPLELPSRTAQPAQRNDFIDLGSQLRRILAALGANEVLTYSFVHGNLLERAGQSKQLAFSLRNALSPELQYYRLSLTPSLLEKVRPNVKQGYDEFTLFELNAVHNKQDKDEQESALPRENMQLACVSARADKTVTTQAGAPYFQAKIYLDQLLGAFGHTAEYRPAKADATSAQPYALKRCAGVIVKDRQIGLIGEYKAAVSAAFKLPRFCAGFELDLKALHELVGSAGNYRQLSRYPAINNDLTLAAPAQLDHQTIKSGLDKLLKLGGVEHSLESLDIYQPSDKTKHHSFRFKMWRNDRTMTQAEANGLIEQAVQKLATKLRVKKI